MGVVAENSTRATLNDEFDPMVVVFGAESKRSGIGIVNGCTTGASRHLCRHRNCVLLAAASVICGAMILWNHMVVVTMPLDTLLSADTSKGKWNESSRDQAMAMLDEHREKKGKEFHPVSLTDQLPSKLLPIIPLHAAEALQCRDSVVSFVINATDVKDECEGLKKAFDKTCGDQPDTGAHTKRSQHAATKRKRADVPHRLLHRRAHRRRQQKQKNNRRLSAEIASSMSLSRKWKLWLFETRRALSRLWRYFLGRTNDFLFVEDEIVKVWNDAEMIVTNELDDLVNAALTRKFESDRKKRRTRELRRLLHEQETTSSGTETTDSIESNITQHVTNRTSKPINLDLPTLKRHASGGAIEGMLMLHQGDKLINQTSAAAQEAAVSSKAMSDTAAAVSTLLNDPTSVEARTCCTSILNVYHENCSSDDEEDISDRRLFLIVLVMALCGVVKSLIRHYRMVWLPEAAGCILVGIASGYVLMFFPHHDISFDGHWFLRIMVPPIIFEAALSIDKKSFNRHIVPIILYAVVGTLFATFITAEILHRGTTMFSRWCTPIPYVESLTFGALISSIDPIAVLSVLNNMGMTDQDTIYVVIFGESLLNDGVAIVLFETLVHFLDENMIIDEHAVSEATYHFLVVASGSLAVGAVAGYAGTVYFWLFQGCQTPLVEVILFFCWALLPYYVCDGIGWSGIVSAVATGFIMDIHIVGQRHESPDPDDVGARAPQRPLTSDSAVRETIPRIFSNPHGHLSGTARAHIGFVAGLIATALETAIFAYLGLFLFSHRYHWSFSHAVIAILACCLSRGIMIPSLSFFVNMSTKLRQRGLCHKRQSSPTAGVVVGRKMQFVLWFAGLRGAMSFALVESIPLYDAVSGQGTPFKPELKAMTSACIMFTVFVLGGYTYYVMDSLGVGPGRVDVKIDLDLTPLCTDGSSEDTLDSSSNQNSTPGSRRRSRLTS